jgi:hypothetical protein
MFPLADGLRNRRCWLLASFPEDWLSGISSLSMTIHKSYVPAINMRHGACIVFYDK